MTLQRPWNPLVTGSLFIAKCEIAPSAVQLFLSHSKVFFPTLCLLWILVLLFLRKMYSSTIFFSNSWCFQHDFGCIVTVLPFWKAYCTARNQESSLIQRDSKNWLFHNSMMLQNVLLAGGGVLNAPRLLGINREEDDEDCAFGLDQWWEAVQEARKADLTSDRREAEKTESLEWCFSSSCGTNWKLPNKLWVSSKLLMSSPQFWVPSSVSIFNNS